MNTKKEIPRLIKEINKIFSKRKKKQNRKLVILENNLLRMYFGELGNPSFERLAVGLTNKDLYIYLCGYLRGLIQ